MTDTDSSAEGTSFQGKFCTWEDLKCYFTHFLGDLEKGQNATLIKKFQRFVFQLLEYSHSVIENVHRTLLSSYSFD